MGLRIIAILLLMVMPKVSSAQQLRLFSNEIRGVASNQQVIVMDFMERYFSELLKKSQADMLTQMADDKVFFRKGKPADLRKVLEDMSVSISLVDKFYIVNWTKEEKSFVTVVFPAQFDLIFGMRQDEAQNQLKDAIACVQHKRILPNPPGDLVKEKGGIFVSRNSHFELESLNDARYYQLAGNEYTPIFSSAFKEYSAANLFQGLIPSEGYRLYIEQTVYGMKKSTYTITLSQWLDYCAWLGLKVYFAVEEEREDGLLAIVLVHSEDFNFNHLLSVVIPDNFTANHNAVLKAKLTSYIPTHNLKDLYQKETKNRKRMQWQ